MFYSYSALAHLLALLLDIVALVWRSEQAKDLEILALRQQVRVLQRAQPTVRPTRGEKLLLAAITSELKRVATRAGRGATVCCSARRRPSCAGTATWCAANGPTPTVTYAGGPAPQRRSRP